MKLPPTKFPPNSTDVHSCCDHPTYVVKQRIEMRMLSDPPPITARQIDLLHWQCHVVEEHEGNVWEGVYEDNVSHTNVFETNDNEKDVGNETQRRN